VRLKTERPRLHKVILLNDDYTPREFVVTVLKGEFRMSEDQAYRVMMTAHRRGVCVVAVYTRDVAETKATRGTEAGRRKGYPLQFTTEPEEYRTSARSRPAFRRAARGAVVGEGMLCESRNVEPHVSVMPLAVLCLAGERRTGDSTSTQARLHRSFSLAP